MNKKPYIFSPYEINMKKDVDFGTAMFIEGYAMACADLMYKMAGDSPCSKSYDPMTIEGGAMHSYAFDMKDGGRHHQISDYKDVGEILHTLLDEALDWIKDD